MEVLGITTYLRPDAKKKLNSLFSIKEAKMKKNTITELRRFLKME